MNELSFLDGVSWMVFSMMLSSLASAIEVNEDTKSEFFAAVQAGDQVRLERLLESTPSLAEVRNEKGVSAPLLALYYGKADVAEWLISRKEEFEPLDVFEAAAFGRVERLKGLVDADPELANACAPDGFFPLGLAAFFRQEDAVRVLLARGAKVNLAARNAMGVAAIHAASASKSLSIARALVEAGADVNQRQESGYTALHEAASSGQLELARLLLDRGADRSAAAADGRTPLDMARQAGHEDLVTLLGGSDASRR